MSFEQCPHFKNDVKTSLSDYCEVIEFILMVRRDVFLDDESHYCTSHFYILAVNGQ